MTITELSLKFDQPLYYPGQMITGHVTVALDKPKDIRGVELKIKGRTKFQWSESESYTDSEGKSQSRTITREGKESYLKSEIKLVSGKTELTIGVHSYPFAVMLPGNSPSTFNGKYGGIAYYGKAKVDIPLAVDKTTKNFFQVENLLDLNNFPHLKTAAKQENSKTFCCFCCASGPLTMVVRVPKTGFAKTESIPVTVEIDNASNVKVDSVNANLSRKIHWQAQGDSKEQKDKIKKLPFGEVPENSSKTWSESMALDCGPFPNIINCNIISIAYKLEVEADPSGAHSDLEVEIPLTIGDIPFHDGESIANPYPYQLPVTPGFPQQISPAVPGGHMPSDSHLNYPNVPGMQNLGPNLGFNPAVSEPYPSAPGGINSEPYPQTSGAYPQGPGNLEGNFSPVQSPYAPQSVQYPSIPYPRVTVGGGPPYEGESSAFNPTLGRYSANSNSSAPPYIDPADGNSVTNPYETNGPNSGFYNPANNPNIQQHGLNGNSNLFSDSSVVMPTSTFLGGNPQGSVSKETNASTPLLPLAPSAPSN